ncbi:MAG: ABC transporter permease [Bacteroidota bacterium]
MYPFKNILRYLTKNIEFTVINILGLALGVTCTIIIATHTFKEYSYNKNIPNNDRIFHLIQKTPDNPNLGSTYITYGLTPKLADQYSEIAYFSRFENYSNFSDCAITIKDHDEELKAFSEHAFYVADSNFFKVFELPFLEGDPANALNSPDAIVLSEETAKKYFGDKQAVGNTLIFNSYQYYTVTGVVRIPEYLTIDFDLLVPITTIYREGMLNAVGGNQNGEPYIRLVPNVDYKIFSEKIVNFYDEFVDESNKGNIQLSLLPITERRLYYGGEKQYLLIFIGLVVLAISIFNYINMSTALIHKRHGEIALKKITGASRKTIAFQFMLETTTMCVAALLLGMVLSFLGAPLFEQLTGSDIKPYIISNIELFIGYGLITLVILIIATGFYPAMVLSEMKPISLLSNNKGRSKSKSILVTTQFAVSIVLIIMTITISRQYNKMAEMPLGFNNEMVMQIPFSEDLKKKGDFLIDELRKIPGVQYAAAGSTSPVGIPHNYGIRWIDSRGTQQVQSMSFAIVTDGYVKTFGMDLINGRPFDDRSNGRDGLIINESAAKILDFENPVGEYIDFWGIKCEVIGVVKDFQNNYLVNEIQPMVFFADPNRQGFTKFLFVSINPSNPEQTIASVEKLVNEVSPPTIFEYTFTSAILKDYIQSVLQINRAFLTGSIMSIILLMIGMIALTHHTIQARIKEIGIRKVNGAKILEVILSLNKSYFMWISTAFLIASPLAWFAMKTFLESFAYPIELSWWIFALSGLLTMSIAAITVSYQSWKAATRNPVEALRYE